MIQKVVRTYPDLDLTVAFKIHDFRVTCSIYNIFATDPESQTVLYIQSGTDYETTNNLDQAEVLIQGNIKATGCADWDFEPAGATLHTCGRDDLERISQILLICYDAAAELCPNWSQ